ncbi:MAG: DUF1588 domain-containing protein [Planctomycetota bacterium]|nr:DUF1588 domain-containing protein [Planctomycetota bacterium]
MLSFKSLVRRISLLVFSFITVEAMAGDFDNVLNPLFTQKCVKCHGDEKANAEITFQSLTSETQLLDQPALIQRIFEAIDTGAMPPDGEPALDDATRTEALSALKSMLRAATVGAQEKSPLRRLNRIQYNNTVRDLFQLNRDVFALPEKLMTRHDNYLQRSPEHPLRHHLPDTVQVASHSLNPEAGLQEVNPFPKDLRAEHGFDNQANQLTLSPLLLDAFLRLSVSIVESPDFNEQTVGIWNDFFNEPAEGADPQVEVKSRLARFLRLAFRGPADEDTLDRYAAYAIAKMNQGLAFPDAMKKVTSAILSSPLFLYRSPADDETEQQFELASRLSYFLWGSGPDEELLQIAERGELSEPEVLDHTISRMLTDPKIERFLDTFPTQWLQLENLLAVTPDPQISKYFSLDPEAPASLQMVLEPLLLFDAVFVEDRPVADLINPRFSYQSEFLKTWYTSELKPPTVDVEKIVADNKRQDGQRKSLQATIDATRMQRQNLVDPVRMQLLEIRRNESQPAPATDLSPYAAWEFDGDLKESIRELDLTAHGEVEFRDGTVVLNHAYLLSKSLPVELRAKSLEVWCRVHNLDQRGGGLMGIQGPGDFFDTIVIGERKNRHWISGSNGFSRTEDFPDSTEETVTDDILHLVMVYADDGTTTLYRNAQPYGKPYRREPAVFPKENTSVIFGLRHLPPMDNKHLSVSIDRARLYDRALTAEEVAASASGHSMFISESDLMKALTPEQVTQREQLTSEIDLSEAALRNVPANIDPATAIQEADRNFEEELKQQLRSRIFHRVDADDPRYGGIITNAAMLSMTSGPKRTHPVARGVWVIEVLFNDPPSPPPNDVPPLDEDSSDKDLTIREKFAAHRENPSCAGCHTKLDPLGFALENFDITGRWRNAYDNGREVDSSGVLLRKHAFEGVVQFKQSLVTENHRFAKAFTEHLLRFALARELTPADAITVDSVIRNTENEGFRIQSLIREVILSKGFVPSR